MFQDYQTIKMKFQDTLYNFNGQVYSQNGLVTLDLTCNGINFVNIGDTVAEVNGIPLSPPAAGERVGDSYSVGGNRGEILQGRIMINFATNAGRLLVVQKYYLEKC